LALSETRKATLIAAKSGLSFIFVSPYSE